MLEAPTENVVPLVLEHAGDDRTRRERLLLEDAPCCPKGSSLPDALLIEDCGQLQAHPMQ